MIVWSGRGFLSVVVLIAAFFLAMTVFSGENIDYAIIIAAYVAGIFSWLFGKKWNGKIIIDEATGKSFKLGNNHTLFWIPMQYWGIIFPVLGMFIAFQNSLVLGGITSLILIAGIIVALVSLNKRKSTPVVAVNSKKTAAATTTKTNFKEVEKEAVDDVDKKRIQKEKEDPKRFMP